MEIVKNGVKTNEEKGLSFHKSDTLIFDYFVVRKNYTLNVFSTSDNKVTCRILIGQKANNYPEVSQQQFEGAFSLALKRIKNEKIRTKILEIYEELTK